MPTIAIIPIKPVHLRPCKQARVAIPLFNLRPSPLWTPGTLGLIIRTDQQDSRSVVGQTLRAKNKLTDLHRRNKCTRGGATLNMSAHNDPPILRRLASAHSTVGAVPTPPDVNPTLKVFGFAADRAQSTDQSAVVVTPPLALPECTKAGAVSSHQRCINTRLGSVDQPAAPWLSVTHTTLTSARRDADLSTLRGEARLAQPPGTRVPRTSGSGERATERTLNQGEPNHARKYHRRIARSAN